MTCALAEKKRPRFSTGIWACTCPAAEIATLEQRTEGWIAGLQLVSLSLQGQPQPAGFVHSFSGDNRYVLDYLVEEVLDQQPAAVQKFLVHTSILSRLSGPLCDAVMQTAGEAQPLLAQLHQANLFLVPLDDEGVWYRFHPLFADVLQHRLHEADPSVVADLHARASAWYEEAGQLADAIHHCLPHGQSRANCRAAGACGRLARPGAHRPASGLANGSAGRHAAGGIVWPHVDTCGPH